MLDISEATQIIAKELPNSPIQTHIVYNGLYVFRVRHPTPGEEDLDPFYSVNTQTGAFAEFSIITDGDMSTVISLFQKASLGS